MKRSTSNECTRRAGILALGFLLLATLQAADGSDGFVGDWALRMENGAAGWLSIHREGGEWSAELWTVGQPKAVTDIAADATVLRFVRQCRIGEPEYPGGPPTGERVPCRFEARFPEGDRDRIQVVMDLPKGGARTHEGTRLPPMPPAPDLSKVRFGEAVELFNGKDLTGWRLANPDKLNGWSVVDGELRNDTPKKTFEAFGRYGNLRTDAVFGDGRWSVEFNVPPGGNSGIYVRGAYEAQVVDRDSRMQGIQGVGAIFGRIPPSRNAGKAGGEWQRYEIILVDRHATVVLNGETVIDNQPVAGNTNGAYQADVMAPGPLYLQGDHTAVRYRNLTFRPVVPSP